MDSINKKITIDFCDSFNKRSDFIGLAPRLIAAGELPEGVIWNKSVQLIQMLCSIGERIPECKTCVGTGIYFNDLCGDCFGTGISNIHDYLEFETKS